MHYNTIRRQLKILFFAIIAIIITLLFIDISRVINVSSGRLSGSRLLSSHTGVIGLYILFFSALILVIGAAFLYIDRKILIPLVKLKNELVSVKSAAPADKYQKGTSDDITEIACAFNDMAHNLEESHEKLGMQTAELSDKNWELQEANAELEASYGQLQAIIEQLNEAEQKYHSLVRNIPEVVCVIDNKGIISFANHVCVDMLGYEKSELTGRRLLDFVDTVTSPVSLDNITAVLNKDSLVTVELILLKKDGSCIITEAKFTNYVFNGINMGLQTIFRDITQKRKMEQEIIQSNKELGILNSVSKSMASTLDIDELSELMVDEITNILGFPFCVLRLVDETGTQLFVKTYAGSFFHGLDIEPNFKTEEMAGTLTGNAINSNEFLLVRDIPEKWNLDIMNEYKADNEKIKEILFIPINVKTKKIGALIIGSSMAIKASDISLISSIANNAAVAVDNALLYETSKKYFIKTIDALIAAVEARDNYTEGHSQRVAKYAVHIARKLGLSREQIEDIKVAGILHDIGKIGISDNILLKPDRLTSEEYEVIKQHPLISNKILYPVGFSERTMKAIVFHHERYDGKGYPYGLTSTDITIEAQIIAVADAFDAMTSNRSYRKAMDRMTALMELTANKATQFNPRVVDTLVELITQFEGVVSSSDSYLSGTTAI